MQEDQTKKACVLLIWVASAILLWSPVFHMPFVCAGSVWAVVCGCDMAWVSCGHAVRPNTIPIL